MTKRVRACRLGYARFLYGVFQRLLQHGFVKMMPALLASNPISVVVGELEKPTAMPILDPRSGICDRERSATQRDLVLSRYLCDVGIEPLRYVWKETP